MEEVPLSTSGVATRSRTDIPQNCEFVIPGHAIKLRAIKSQLGIIYTASDKQPANPVTMERMLVSPRIIQNSQDPVRLIKTSN